jgi:acyl carrier protein
MDRKEILEKLTPIARTVFESPELVLTDEMSSETMDKWTSLSFMQLLTAIEQEFGFRFKMMELLSLKNMGDIINTIAKHS